MKLKSTELKFKKLGNPPTTIQTPDNRISLPTQVLAVGSVGRGKTFWITNLLRQLKELKLWEKFESDLKHAEPRDLDYLTAGRMLFYDVNTHEYTRRSLF
jgi:DNA helicase HerA-like ATPase